MAELARPTEQPVTTLDLIALVPHLLGFQPTESVAVLPLHGARVGHGIAVDYGAGPADSPEVNRAMATLLEREPTAAILICYETITNGSDSMAANLATILADAGLDLVERVVVTPTHWRHFECGCCPPEGHALPVDEPEAVRDFRAATDSAPAANRRALRARLAPDARAAQVATLCAATAGTIPTSEWASAWARLLAPSRPLESVPALDLAIACMAAHEGAFRDALIFALCPDFVDRFPMPDQDREGLRAAMRGIDTPLDANQALRMVHRLTEVGAAMPDPQAAPTLAVLATVAWWHGQVAVGEVAVERAIETDPSCRLAQLIGTMLTLGLRPQGE